MKYILVHFKLLSNGIILIKHTKGKTIVSLNTFILTKIKLKIINNVSLPDISSKKLRSDTIRFGAVYLCDITHDEILENIFKREELNYNELILEGEVECSDDESECYETLFLLRYICLFLIIKIFKIIRLYIFNKHTCQSQFIIKHLSLLFFIAFFFEFCIT